jgi:hypothetical protein
MALGTLGGGESDGRRGAGRTGGVRVSHPGRMTRVGGCRKGGLAPMLIGRHNLAMSSC